MMRKLLLCLGIAFAAIGCTKEVDVSQFGENALTITSNISTKVTDGKWDKKDAIGVYMTSETLGDNGENKEYTTANGDGVFTSDDPLYIPSNNVSIFAYYPYVENVDLSAYQIYSENQYDVLSVTNDNVAASSSTVDLTFNHLLSKVSLTIEPGDGLTADDLKDLVVKISGISTVGTFDINSKVATITNSATELELTTDATGVSSSAIVIPQSLSGVAFTFTTMGFGTFSATPSTEEFTTGKEYTYKVTIQPNGVEITSSNINGWDTSNGTESSTASIVDIEYKSDVDKYYINSAKGLAAFRDLVNLNGSNSQNATFAGFDESAFASDNLSINGVLTRNISLSEICGEEVGDNGSSVSWNGMGYSSNATGSWVDYMYIGKFDGDGYEISGLYTNGTSQQALFKYVGNGGVVCNLGVSGEVTGTSSGTASQAAGIVGKNYGFVINCYSEVNVTGDTNVGGIVAFNEGNVVNCYNRGDISGNVNNVGGVVGQNEEGGYVGYCYSTGEVYLSADITTDRRIGGVVGYNHTTTAEAPTIKGCFCIESKNTDYSIGQVETSASSGGLTGNVCTAEYLRSESFVITINNGSATYNIGGNNPPVNACEWVYSSEDYPTLNFGKNPSTVILDISYNSISYNINTGKGLQAFAALVNGEEMPSGVVTSGDKDVYFKFGTVHPDIDGRLTANIDLSEVCSADSEISWTPIGSYYPNEPSEILYSGTFEGNGYEVQNLYINSSSDYQGLFGYVGAGGVISNLGVSGYIKSSSSISQVAGVVGNNLGLVINCYNKVEIASNGYIVGGVVGLNGEGGFVVNCYNQGKIQGETFVGGIIGRNTYTSSTEFGSLICSYNTGTIVGHSSSAAGIGGCVGCNVSDGSSSGATVSDSYYLSTSTDYVIGAGYGVGNGNNKTESEMQGISSTLNKAAASYNTNYSSSAVAACGWCAVTDGYPAHVYGSTPNTGGTYTEAE